MFRFEHHTTIRLPIRDVFHLYTDPDHMPAWQPGLVDIEDAGGPAGRPGGIRKLRYQLGRRKMVMTETILHLEAPRQYHVQYALKGLRQIVRHQFDSIAPNETKWTTVSEFHFRGMMWLIGGYMRTGLETQSRTLMQNFKGYAEQAGNAQAPQPAAT